MIDKYSEMMIKKLGTWVLYNDFEVGEMYKTYNHLTEDYEGITREDFKKIQIINKKCFEITEGK